MVVVTRQNQTPSGGQSVLQEWLFRKTLENFEPNLTFYAFGEKPMVQDGYATVAWARFSRIDTNQITEMAADGSQDGTTPNSISFTASAIKASPRQYIGIIRISDMVAQLNAIGFVEGALKELGAAMARKIDEVIQAEVMAGQNVRYVGGHSARSSVTSSDLLKANEFNLASAFLANKNAPTYDGYYVAFVHPFAVADLRAENGTGSWMEVNKYATPEKIFRGEIGMLNGVRVIMNSHIKPFVGQGSGGINVYPTLVLGKGAYGVTDFQSLRTYVVPARASDSDPAAQRTSVAVKVAFAAKRLQEDAMLRIEHAVTEL